MAGLDAFDADAEPEPPKRNPAQVEQGVGGSEGDPVIAADVRRQAALMKQPFKHVNANSSLVEERPSQHNK